MNNLDYKAIFNYRGESYNNASDKYPNARRTERQALINLLKFPPQSHILDVPAGGGYLATGIEQQAGKHATITCIEPAANFANGICRDFEQISASIDCIPLVSQSIDIIASLAGLHHIKDRTGTFSEWHRLLKPGGQIAVADVAADTGPANFLNIFVNQYTPQGHQGIFFPEGEFSRHLRHNHFEKIQEQQIAVPWAFNSLEDMAEFCILLFYLTDVSQQQVLDNLDKYVGIQTLPNQQNIINWQLCYAYGVKT